MSVAPVSLMSVIGTQDKLDKVISFCGDSGMFQPENVSSFYSDAKELKPIETNNIYRAPLENMLRVAKESSNTYKDVDAVKDMSDDELFGFSVNFTRHMDSLNQKKQDLLSQISNSESFKKQIEHFVGLDLDFEEIVKCRFIKIRLGRLPKESKPKLEKYKDNPYVLFFTATDDEKYEWGVYICPIDHIEEVDMIFSKLYFERLRIYGVKTTPEQELLILNEKIKALHTELAKNDEEIKSYWQDNIDKSSKVFSSLSRLFTYSDVKKYAASYHNSFILTGWIPRKSRAEFKKGISAVGGVECAFDKPEEVQNHTPPTILKNNRFFSKFEFFVEMYGSPSYKEVDPTIFVSITYILLYGAMFGDFGNGLVLAIAGYLMWRFKKMALGRVLIPCGISSMFFGVLFGSCFGFEDTFNGFYQTVFNLPSKPIETMDPLTTNYIIYSAVGIGFVLVMIAMLINIYSCFRRGNVGKAVFGENGICGFVFYVSLVAGIVCQLIFNIPVMNIFYIIFLLVLPILGVLFEPVLDALVKKDKSAMPEKWGDFLVQRFFEVFEILLSYATNTISFLRVGAYVLVHTGMLIVVFTLADMTTGVAYVLIVALGNAFVIALEGLLVGIQVLRLEFYEMFSRFFDGDGEAFRPILVPKSAELLK